MGENTTLMARDGHEFGAWLAAPKGKARGAVIVIQEIFGVNSHIRAVTDGYADEGYVAIAPALFDRVRRGIELGYEGTMDEGRGYVAQIPQEKITLDLTAALNVVKHTGRVGAVGFCWGGKQAYLAACTLPVACAVAYYGGSIASSLDRKPKHPVMFHFGEHDTHIPLSDVEKIRAAVPDGVFHVYDAGHGFNCDQRASYHAESAKLARARTLEFLARHVAGDEH
jgi:carboxymethylenebutenolidase